MRCVTRWFMTLAVAMVTSMCGGSGPSAPVEEEPAAIAVTAWTNRTEVFMEYPPLVAQETGRFAVHLTDLATFQPVTVGRVEVRLEGSSGATFRADGPSRPGIFGVDVIPPGTGRYQLVVELEGEVVSDVHRLGEVTVYLDAQAAAAAVPPGEEADVAFLKEQQWQLDFATASVGERALRGGLSVPAEVQPRIGGEVEVRATTAGRVVTEAERPVGTQVNKGEVLAELIARNERVGQRPVLELELAEAEARLRLARTDRSRVERLASVGAVPTRRLAEAQVAEETAETRVQNRRRTAAPSRPDTHRRRNGKPKRPRPGPRADFGSCRRGPGDTRCDRGGRTAAVSDRGHRPRIRRRRRSRSQHRLSRHGHGC